MSPCCDSLQVVRVFGKNSSVSANLIAGRFKYLVYSIVKRVIFSRPLFFYGEYCRACGRCASACPRRAIEIRIDDPDFLEKAYRRIRAHVKFD